MTRRALVVACLVVWGCALRLPALVDGLNRGDFEAIVRSGSSPRPEATPRFKRLAISPAYSPDVVASPAIQRELARCAARLKDRGIASEITFLPDPGPRCFRLLPARSCAGRVVDAYRAAALDAGDDALLVTALVLDEAPAVPPVIPDGHAALIPEPDAYSRKSASHYITEGGILEPGSGRVHVYGLGTSDSRFEAILRPPQGRKPPDLGAQSMRRFCQDLEYQLFEQ